MKASVTNDEVEEVSVYELYENESHEEVQKKLMAISAPEKYTAKSLIRD